MAINSFSNPEKNRLLFFNESGVMKKSVLILAIFHLNVEPEGNSIFS